MLVGILFFQFVLFYCGIASIASRRVLPSLVSVYEVFCNHNFDSKNLHITMLLQHVHDYLSYKIIINQVLNISKVLELSWIL